MSNFLIFKAAFNGSATPAIGAYTAEGATAQFNRNTDISPDYYLYNTADGTAVQWFVPTAETTDFEFVADILTRQWTNRVTYFIIADSTGTTRLRMWSVYANWHFENSDSDATSGTEHIGVIDPTTSGGFGVFHQFRVRVRKLTASSSSVEVYVDGTLKITATAGAALVTCAKIGFVGGVNTFGPGTGAGIKNAYVYDLSGGDVIDRGVLSGAFNRFISWMKSKFALKSDIPTVNNGTLTIQKNGVNVQTFTANQSTAATANITVPTAVSELANDSGYLTSSSNLDASKLTSGTVDIARLPQGALERLVKVANEAARYALTTAEVQLGDTVQQLDTGIMYIVTDTDHLDSAAGYTEYTAGTAASVPWSGVTGKPTFAAVATSGSYNDLDNKPTIPTVNNATLTIQRNGTTVDTFTANASVDKTININTADDTKIPLAGSNAISGSLIPSTDGTVNLGGPSYQWNNAYIKSLAINGVACGNILTHNASEFVNVTGAQTIGGTKTFSSKINGTIDKSKDYYLSDNTLASENGSLGTVKYYSGMSTADLDTEIFEHSLWASSKAVNSIPTTLDVFYYVDQYFYGGRTSTSNRIQILRGYRNANLHMVRVYDNSTNSWSAWAKFADESDVVPRSGGAVMSGGILGRTVDTGSLMISGGTSWSSGGSLEAFGSSHSSYAGQVRLRPALSDANLKTMNLEPSGTWTWNGTACQITSDQRLKQQITKIDDKLLDAWEDVDLVQFKYNDAVDAKKDKARLHTGYVVQQIDKACKSHGVDISEYGLYCHEEYPEETEEVEVEQADGTKTKETKVIREASEHYSLRYTEVYAVECMYLRRCIARLTARIEELEKGKEQEASK